MKILGQPVEKAALTMDKYGYTGSACVPIAFAEMIKQNKVKRGDRVLFCASGAGLEVGTNLFVY
jgi:3-oxoacyl-[acyl-carrier-protein] synthase-3